MIDSEFVKKIFQERESESVISNINFATFENYYDCVIDTLERAVIQRKLNLIVLRNLEMHRVEMERNILIQCSGEISSLLSALSGKTVFIERLYEDKKYANWDFIVMNLRELRNYNIRILCDYDEIQSSLQELLKVSPPLHEWLMSYQK